MWYEIEHVCGHKEQVQIYGTNVHGEREKRAAWLASKPCRACQAKAAAEAASRAGMAELRGSEKQVAWAEQIRQQMASALDEAIADLGARAEELRGALASQEDAGWFIENRFSVDSPRAIIAALAKTTESK